MNTRNIIAVAALSLLATVGAQAETYNGVHPLVSANSRAEVQAQAIVAAHRANPYADGASSGPAQVIAGNVDRATVRAQAVAAAHTANPYAEGFNAGVTSLAASTVDRAAVRAEARAAVRNNQLAL
ncbi:MAG: helicase SNF2 [Variovorax sp.]|nr:MAG: helicase SNF2 [Variovorax sp.]